MGDLGVGRLKRIRVSEAHPSRLGSRDEAVGPIPKRIAGNFAYLLGAEVVCRGASVVATLALTSRLGASGYGRIEFAFSIVFWLVLIVRDCFETIVTREVARHPRITRALVNHVLAVKIALASTLFLLVAGVSGLTLADPADRRLLGLYGLLLITTSLGIDFVFRGTERMRLVAVSLCVRTGLYCAGVFLCVRDPSQVGRVPLLLVGGEAVGIALVWWYYSKEYGLPRPQFRRRFLNVILKRGRAAALIQLSQAVLVTVDLLIVGFLSGSSDVGRYGAPHRMVAAAMGFGLIFQHVVFPSISRGWRKPNEEGRRLLETAVRVLMLGYVPLAVGATALSGPLVALLLPAGFRDSDVLLAVGVWKAPLFSLAFLYQSALIALNRESAGLRLLLAGAAASLPLIALGYACLGLVGAAYAVLALGVTLAATGYLALAREGLAPRRDHHLAIPIVGSAAMLPVCLGLRGVHVLASVAAGAVVYGLVVAALGGFRGLTLKAGVGVTRAPRLVSSRRGF